MEERREHFSRKRQAILDALRDTGSHPTAEGLYAQLKPLYPDLSLGTVYRNLGRLRENGQTVSLGVISGHERFDADTAPHAHLVCERCGAVVDVPARMPGREEFARVSQETGCVAQTVSLTFRGLCPDCARECTQNREELHGE